MISRKIVWWIVAFVSFLWGISAGVLPASEPVPTLDEAVAWLQAETKKMIRESRREMPNRIAAFPPQAGSGYEAFWLRDYAYMLEGCPEAFTPKELTEACRVFLGALRDDGAGVDCVKFTGEPIYKPGYGRMGANPVADGSQFTVAVVWHTFQATHDRELLDQALDKLLKTMAAVPRNPVTGLVHIKPEGWDRCPYGFTDTVRKQGDELFCSLLFVEACRQLSDLLSAANRFEEAARWRQEAERLIPSIRETFWDEKEGLFRAATIRCKEPDIWGSAFAVYLDVAAPEQARTIARYFKDHYREIVQCGQIRHLPGGVYWEESCPRNSYQNGGYWATATGWFVYTLDRVDSHLADQTVTEMVQDFQKRGIHEWILDSKTNLKNYLASGAMPLVGVRKMQECRHGKQK